MYTPYTCGVVERVYMRVYMRRRRLVVKWTGTRKRLFYIFFLHGWDFRNAETVTYMHVCLCSWALGICKNIGIWTYSGSVTAESVGFSRHFALCIRVPRLATFFIAPKNCIS